MSRQAGSIVRGISKPRRISVISGPAAGGGYLLRDGQKVKVWRNRRPSPWADNGGPDPSKSMAGRGLEWQEWQGSNLRPPVLETGALPIELHSCREPGVAAGSRRFKHRPYPVCKGEAVNRPVSWRDAAAIGDSWRRRFPPAFRR